MDVDLAGHRWQIVAQRAIVWPARRMLLVADVHVGKTDIFRNHGIAVPVSVQTADLHRLQALLQSTGVERCVVLGDLVHGAGLAAHSLAEWNQLVDAHRSVRFELVAGNHDRWIQHLPLSLDAVHPMLLEQGVCLSHEPMLPGKLQTLACKLNVHGHIHPALRLPGSRSKIPAVVWTPPHLCLPAFSEFTAGVAPAKGWQALWAVDAASDSVTCIRPPGDRF